MGEHRTTRTVQSDRVVVQDETGEAFYTCQLIDSTYPGADGQDVAFLRACQTSDGTPLEPVFVTEIEQFGKSYYKCPNSSEFEFGTPMTVETLVPSSPGVQAFQRDSLGFPGHDTQKCSIVPQRKH